MTSMFEDLKQGLEEAIAFEQNAGIAYTTDYEILPVKEFTHSEIRDIRMKAGMTQRVFAYYMGVSQKTVEAWECGRTHPTGPAYRLLAILASGTDNTSTFIRKIE